MPDRQQTGVARGQAEFIGSVADPELPIVQMRDLQAVALFRQQRALVEPIDDLLSEPLDEAKVEHVTRRRQMSFDANAYLIVMPVQRLAEAGIGDEMCGRELQILLGHVYRKPGVHACGPAVAFPVVFSADVPKTARHWCAMPVNCAR